MIIGKRGILGTIFLGVLLALFLTGLFLYFQIKTSGLEFKTGNIIIKLSYDNSEDKKTASRIIRRTNETNSSLEDANSSLTYNSNSSIDYEDLTSP